MEQNYNLPRISTMPAYAMYFTPRNRLNSRKLHGDGLMREIYITCMSVT